MPNSRAVGLELADLRRRLLVDHRQACAGCRRASSGPRSRRSCPGRRTREAARAQAGEGLGAGDLVDEVEVDGEDAGAPGSSATTCVVPDLLDERARAGGGHIGWRCPVRRLPGARVAARGATPGRPPGEGVRVRPGTFGSRFGWASERRTSPIGDVRPEAVARWSARCSTRTEALERGASTLASSDPRPEVGPTRAAGWRAGSRRRSGSPCSAPSSLASPRSCTCWPSCAARPRSSRRSSSRGTSWRRPSSPRSSRSSTSTSAARSTRSR